MRALEAARSAPWVMLPERVKELLAIAARENEVTPQALEAYRARAVAGADRMTVRDGVAILPIVGPLFRRANLFTEFSGATSYAVLRRDLQIALDDPAVSGIILNIDSPGGEANGCDELAAAIYAARGSKRIVSYVGGVAASGGYWLASGAEEIVVGEAALLGSIGAALAITDTKGRDEAKGVRTVEFVSSQSPGKRPDVSSEDGRAQIQRMVDDLADVFIGAVARHRGISSSDVAARFGQGGMEIGAKAVAAGMADRLGSFEAVLTELSHASQGRTTSQTRRISMSEINPTPAAEAAAGVPRADHDTAVQAAETRGRDAGAQTERDRLAAILGADGIKGDAAKMTAAIEMATKFTTASAEDVTTFVAANVGGAPAATPAALPAAVAGLAQRMATAEGALPTGADGANAKTGPVSRIVSNYRSVTGTPSA